MCFSFSMLVSYRYSRLQQVRAQLRLPRCTALLCVGLPVVCKNLSLARAVRWWCGVAWHGVAWRGMASRGVMWLATARYGRGDSTCMSLKAQQHPVRYNTHDPCRLNRLLGPPRGLLRGSLFRCPRIGAAAPREGSRRGPLPRRYCSHSRAAKKWRLEMAWLTRQGSHM